MMRRSTVRFLIRLYPRAWRDRYGEEFAPLLESEGSGGRSVADVVWAALRERVRPTWKAERDPRSFGAVIRHPSALAPIAMSLIALAVVLGHIALYGAAREADEGAAAHIWQLLMAGQPPILAFFVIKWLPRAPRQTLAVIALQAGSVMAALAPVFYLNL
jgi:hypothetical protein